ncbi:MAG: ion channel [Rickettsiales bacterium]
MLAFLIATLLCFGLVVTCVVIFYEVLAHVWVNLPRLDGRPRLQILLSILAMFVAHSVAVWIYGATYYVLDKIFDFGSLSGAVTHDFFSYIYFSAVSYSSLGLGDVYPTGGLQLLVGVEAITGLILIGWSVTFTYVVTEKYLFHRRMPPR